MKIIIAPDSFKGSLTAKEVCYHIEKGILKKIPDAQILKIPVADGGEGTIDALLDSLNGKLKNVDVHNPIGNKIQGYYGLIDDSTAIIEMAVASGLPLLTDLERNPLQTNTYGTGELIMDALNSGCNKIIICIGGSATNDGGAGMLKALGVKFYNQLGLMNDINGGNLNEILSFSLNDFDKRIEKIKIIVACDVINPLLGINGASEVFAPQKGADKNQVKILENNLTHFADIVEEHFKKEFRNLPGSGAAGGLGFSLLSFLNAELKNGIDIVLNTIDFEQKISSFQPSLIITGEGKMDYQTAFGKAPLGVAILAKKFNIPVIAFCGSLGKNYEHLFENGFDGIFSIMKNGVSLKDSMENAGKFLENAVKREIEINSRQLFQK